MNRFQDDASLPVQDSKKRKGLLIVVGSIVLVVAMFVMVKAGASTKDPKKAAAEASKVSREESGEATSRSAQATLGDMVGTDGAHKSNGENTEKDIKAKIDHNLKQAEQNRLDHDREEFKKQKEDERRRAGLPGGFDAQGRPVDAQAQGQPGQPGVPRQPVIPGFAAGWNPEQDIIVPAGEGVPSYRYIPAYLRGTNNPNDSRALKKLDDKWIDSIGKPSYGASKTVQTEYNQDVPAQIAIGRPVRAAGPIQTGGVMVRQAPGQTPMECVETAPRSLRRLVPKQGGAE